MNLFTMGIKEMNDFKPKKQLKVLFSLFGLFSITTKWISRVKFNNLIKTRLFKEAEL